MPRLGLQGRVAETGKVQLVERRRDEACAIGGVHPPGRRDAKAVSREAGIGVVELRIAVAAQVELPAVRAVVAVEAAKDGVDRPLRDCIGSGGADILFESVPARPAPARAACRTSFCQVHCDCSVLKEPGKLASMRVGGVVALVEAQLRLPLLRGLALDAGMRGRHAHRTAVVGDGPIVEPADAVGIQQAGVGAPATAEFIACGGVHASPARRGRGRG